MCKRRPFSPIVLCILVVASLGADIDLASVQSMLSDRADQAVELLLKEVSTNPAHEAARVLLAEAYEKAGKPDDAQAVWREVLRLSDDDATQHQARRAISRLQRAELDRADREEIGTMERQDPFKIPMPDVDWEKLRTVEDTNYLPPLLGPPVNFQLPPFVHETEHFTVYSANDYLSRVVGERAEIYLDFMVERLFNGRSWPARIPILVYKDINDYHQHGGPQGSAGVTMGHPLSGLTRAIIIFQLKPDFSTGGRRGGGGGSEVWKYGIESVLPHELTHAVVNEFFAGRRAPQWLHEAIAGRFEQTRDHYGEAARLARKVVAGEYFRMRDLFAQEGYPERVMLFYEQSAIVVLYLFEAGPEAMHAFLTELAQGNGHDAACAAALGIPEEGAVEEFERRWVEWMKLRYAKDLKAETDQPIISTAAASRASVFLPWANEVDTFGTLEGWRSLDLSSMAAFRGLGRSAREWKADGKLACSPASDGSPSVLSMRMNEAPPLAVQATVRFLGAAGADSRFGFTQLDVEGYDTPVQVIAPLRDGAPHTVTCVWADDLALYIDGNCVGRYPARAVTGNDRDIDFPLGLVTYGAVEVTDLKVAPIKAFSTKPIVAAANPSTGNTAAQPASGEGENRPRRSRTRTRTPATPP